MIKFIITTIFILLLIRLVAPFLIRFLIKLFIGKQLRKAASQFGGGFGTQSPFNAPNTPGDRQQKKAPNSNLNIDYIPEEKKERKDFRGGDYVEYEEVK